MQNKGGLCPLTANLRRQNQDLIRPRALCADPSGDRVEGIYCPTVELASGRFALIEKSREFTLVP